MVLMIRLPGTTFKDAQVQILKGALEHCGWDRDKAAKMLDIPRTRFKDIPVPEHATEKFKREKKREDVRRGKWGSRTKSGWGQLVPQGDGQQ
jgi:hypothetical protein